MNSETMGVDLAGVLIDKNYQQDLPSLERILGVRLVPEGEVLHCDPMAKPKDDDHCVVCFSECGTLVYTRADFADEIYHAEGQRVMSFVWTEGVGCQFLYTEGGILRRAKVYADGELYLDEGEPLPEELLLARMYKDLGLGGEGVDNTSDLIEALFLNMFGQPFGAVDPDSKCYRYRMLREGEETSQMPRKLPRGCMLFLTGGLLGGLSVLLDFLIRLIFVD